jgi:hypothetical protein
MHKGRARHWADGVTLALSIQFRELKAFANRGENVYFSS